jgi:MoaA/NifB/PqqE/SkfB family radical SAM enzyme
MLIYSITESCNLNCKGCYAKALHASKASDLGSEKFAELIDQADSIGISLMLLAGGEPFSRPDLLEVTAKHPSILFPVFTNGLLLNEEHLKKLQHQKNVIPVISLEGDERETDERRGAGVFAKTRELIQRLNARRIYYGISITVTRDNFEYVTSPDYVEKTARLGSKVFFYINYVPVQAGTEDQMLTGAQLGRLNGIMAGYRRQYAALFVAFPSGEEEFGGCLAASKGFVHITQKAMCSPVPFLLMGMLTSRTCRSSMR